MPPSHIENLNDTTIQAPKYNGMGSLAGKVALITGAGRGIGRAIALELAARGCSVVVGYSSSGSKAEAVVSEIVKCGSKAIAVRADVTKPEEIFKLFEVAMNHFGKLDIVISNAGSEVWFKEEDVTPDDFDYIFDLNCRGQFFVAQQGLKYLQHGGRIILTSSVAATMSGIPNHALYAGSKAAVEGFTRSFSVDCGEKGITVNAIAPGGVKTDMYDENAWHYVPNGYPGMHLAAIDDALARFCPLKRVGLPSDIAKAVALLVSPEGEWINGQVIKLTGGSMT
ncbi:versicolorin reductase [Xylogone sp. PMI_703]|nr:versicolorin reductase [Xylogone sp. PMI_703]